MKPETAKYIAQNKPMDFMTFVAWLEVNDPDFALELEKDAARVLNTGTWNETHRPL
jgi:hypothetical protein